MDKELVTREKLASLGFMRLPDVWLPCPIEGRHVYFERWYHVGWNYTAIIGLPGRDPLGQNSEDFVARVQMHLLDWENACDHDPWDDTYAGF